MSNDDRDADSPNPSKSFKVGEFDRLSGFFTPVWESKRRLRSDSPIPSSSAAASAPSSARGSDTAASRPSAPPPPRRSSPPPAPSTRHSQPPPAATPSSSLPAVAPSAPARAEPATPSAELAGAVSSEPAELEAKAFHATPLAPPTARATDGAGPAAGASAEPAADIAAASGSDVPPADAAPDPQLAAALAAAAVTVRPVIPMPLTPGRAPQRGKSPSTPPPAADSPKRVGADAPLEREPEFRAPAPVAAKPELLRSGRAAAVAGALHDRFLKHKTPIESADTFGRHRETESEREATLAAAARAASAPADPYPSHVLRTLRRTIHLSTPLPDFVRQMIEKYRY